MTPVLQGNASLFNIATGHKVVALQSDPDSLKVDSAGDLVLDSQADGDLIFINAPGTPNQAALRLHLSNGSSTQITVDDTVFPTSPSGTIFVVDTQADTVYAVKSDAFRRAELTQLAIVMEFSERSTSVPALSHRLSPV